MITTHSLYFYIFKRFCHRGLRASTLKRRVVSITFIFDKWPFLCRLLLFWCCMNDSRRGWSRWSWWRTYRLAAADCDWTWLNGPEWNGHRFRCFIRHDYQIFHRRCGFCDCFIDTFFIRWFIWSTLQPRCVGLGENSLFNEWSWSLMKLSHFREFAKVLTFTGDNVICSRAAVNVMHSVSSSSSSSSSSSALRLWSSFAVDAFTVGLVRGKIAEFATVASLTKPVCSKWSCEWLSRDKTLSGMSSQSTSESSAGICSSSCKINTKISDIQMILENRIGFLPLPAADRMPIATYFSPTPIVPAYNHWCSH